MDVADNVRPRYYKILVAALKRRTAKIVRREVALLQHRSHCPVEDQHTCLERVEESLPAYLLIFHEDGPKFHFIGRALFPPGNSRERAWRDAERAGGLLIASRSESGPGPLFYSSR